MNTFLTGLGWYGAVAVLVAHIIVSRNFRVPRLYCHLLNLTGSIGLIGCAYVAKDFPLTLLNIAWAGIALSAIVFPERSLSPSSTEIECIPRSVTATRD